MSRVNPKEFEALHDKLLNCYATIFARTDFNAWKNRVPHAGNSDTWDDEAQKLFCRNERLQLEDVYLNGRLSIEDFFNEKLKA